MPDLKISDSLGNPMDLSAVKWTSASSLYKYAKSELLHLAVAPDYVEIKDKPLSQAIPKPTCFSLSVQNGFDLGGAKPEIDLTPGTRVELRANATAGCNLFDDDPFHIPVTVPEKTAYVGWSFQGSLDLGVCGTSGDLTFGINENKSITFEFLKAFDTAQNEPTLWTATTAALSGFVIPASVDDLKRLQHNDICTVCGVGELTVSGSVNVAIPVNPLASVSLPLNVGTLAVQDGIMLGLSASLCLSGSYQIRVESRPDGVVRLSYLRDRDASFHTDLSASAGVEVNLNKTDLLPKLLGAIAKEKVDQKALDGLTDDQISAFNCMVKDGINHSLCAGVDLALAKSIDDRAAFQYEIELSQLDASSTDALNRALRGDLTRLTVLEETVRPDGTLAPGVKLLNSVFSTAKTLGFALKLNLIGIVNLISSSQLLNNCEVLFDESSGDITIKETAESDRLSAITDPYKRQDALRKALFESVLVTTTYRVSKTVAMPDLACEAAHFAKASNASREIVSDYTRWLQALNLLKNDQREAMIDQASRAVSSSCVVRAPLDDAACESLFFDNQGQVRTRDFYLEVGRQALLALLNSSDPVDPFRSAFFANDATWQKALEIGPSPELRNLIPLTSTDPRFAVVFNDISGDLYDIVWWANSMQKAGEALLAMRSFLIGRDPATLPHDPNFAGRRDALQKLMLGVVQSSKLRFREPWGLVCLYWASGSRRSFGKLTAGTYMWQNDTAAPSAASAGRG